MKLQKWLMRGQIATVALYSVGLAALPTDAWACADNVAISASAGDGSVLLSQLTVVPVHIRRAGTTNWISYTAFVPPSQTLTCFHPGAGTWDLRIQPNGYFASPAASGVVTCSAANVCTGSATFTVYRNMGSISGTATVVPPGSPLVGAGVYAYKPKCTPPYAIARADATDSSGHYTLKDNYPSDPDNVGAPVDGDGSAPGTAHYEVALPGQCDSAVPVDVSSNMMAQADVTRRAPYAEEPIRECSAGLGNPVNVLNGNMYFDHTDVVLPGRSGLRFVRSYNSKTRGTGQYGAFGVGWNHSYEQRLSFPATSVIALRDADGQAIYFEDLDGDLTYVASLPATERDKIVQLESTYVRNRPGGGTEIYDGSGRLTTITDPGGNMTTLTRDAAGKLTTISDAGGRALTLTYSDNRISSLSGPAGVIATYAYTASRLTGVTYADGSGYDVFYDTSGRLLTVADRSGRILETHEYGAGDAALTTEISGGQEKHTLTYAPLSTVATDALGNTTTYQWATVWGRKVITTIAGPCGTCGIGGEQSQERFYDERGRLVARKDALGQLTSYTYDADGNLTTETDPLGRTTTRTYDALGRELTVSRPGGGLTTYTWGPAGPLTVTEKISGTEDRVTSITYNAIGKPERIIDPRGKSTWFTYDALGDLTSVADPLNHTTTYGYDAMGRRTTITDALDHTTTTTYNDRGLVTRVTYHDGTHADFTYDLGGRRTSASDPMGNSTTYDYDAYGRLASVTDAMSGITAYGYDAMSRLASLTDARGKTTSFEYDAFGRLTRTVYPGGAFEANSYDAAGHLATRTDRRGVVTTYSYDPAGRLTEKSYSDGTPAVSYTYDAAGRLATAANGDDSLTYTYDLSGQLVSEQSAANSSLVAYTYDVAGNRLSVGLDGAVHASYGYDDAGRLTSITRGGSVFGFAYDNASRRTGMTYPNGVATTYAYDSMDHLTRIAATSPGANPVTDIQYSYDPAGNRTRKQQLDYAEDYSYDDLHRLTQADRDGGTTEGYTYDAVGNRLSSIGSPSWLYDDGNRLLSQNGTTYTYDSNGNLTSKTEGSDNWTYTWNAENQLTRVLKNSIEQARFSYDPLGRRVEKAAMGATTSYAYDGDNILREMRGSTTLKYVHGLDVDEPLAVEASDGVTHFHADALGSIVTMTNVAGAVTLTRQYDASGKLQASADQPGYAFTGREWDPGTGLYYYRARYYDPSIGSFISEDPMGFYGGSNFYTYVRGNPVNLIDPFGWVPECRYSISAGRMVCTDGGRTVHDSRGWVSGQGGACQNNPSAQCTRQRGTGPIPPGRYTSTGRPGHRPPNTTRRNLAPDPTNQMHGRGDFQTHYCPDPATCSNGCPSQTNRNTSDDFNHMLDQNPNTPVTVEP